MRLFSVLSSVLLLGSFASASEIDEDMLHKVRSATFHKVYQQHRKAIRMSLMLKNCNENEISEMIKLSEDAIAETIIDYLGSIMENPKHEYHDFVSNLTDDEIFQRIVEDVNGYVNGYRIGFKEAIEISPDFKHKEMCKLVKEDALKLAYKNLKSEKH